MNEMKEKEEEEGGGGRRILLCIIIYFCCCFSLSLIFFFCGGVLNECFGFLFSLIGKEREGRRGDKLDLVIIG